MCRFRSQTFWLRIPDLPLMYVTVQVASLFCLSFFSCKINTCKPIHRLVVRIKWIVLMLVSFFFMRLNYLLRQLLIRKDDLAQVLLWANPFTSRRNNDFFCKWDNYIWTTCSTGLVWQQSEKMCKFFVNWKSYFRRGSKHLPHSPPWLWFSPPQVQWNLWIDSRFPSTSCSSRPHCREHSIHTENSCHSLQAIFLVSRVVLILVLLETPDSLSLLFSDIILTK